MSVRFGMIVRLLSRLEAVAARTKKGREASHLAGARPKARRKTGTFRRSVRKPEWAENPEFVLPNLPEIVDLVPEGWDSLKGLEGLLDNIQFTLQLDSYNFSSGDGTGSDSVVGPR